ncbi:MAG: transaldolase family protein [Candidatus Helarchaeota archaeon]
MQIFIDSANLKIIERFTSYGIIDGVTTNPTFMKREGIRDIDTTIKHICDIVKGPVHVEAMGKTPKDILAEAKRLLTINKNLVMKIPIDWKALQAVKLLKNEEIQTNIHLIFSVKQAILAAKAGATFVCPLVGRLYDHGQDGMKVIKEIKESFDACNYSTKIMVSSVRNPDHVKESAKLGVDIITIPPYVLDLMIKHPLTEEGVGIFRIDSPKLVKDVMVSGDDIPKISVKSPIMEAIVEMTNKKLGMTSVINTDGKCVGIITDGDLRRLIQLKKDLTNVKVADVYTKNPKTISKDEFATEALKEMEKHNITSLLVLNENQIVEGVIHMHQVMKMGIRLEKT